MLRVFYGENRLEAEKAVKKQLGEGYEVYEGESLVVGDLPSIFQGMTLFGALGTGVTDGVRTEVFSVNEKVSVNDDLHEKSENTRRILLKNVSENSLVWEKLPEYWETEYEVAVWEGKIDKRSVGYKRLKEVGVEMVEFPALRGPEANVVFGILDTAMKDGKRAVKMVERIEVDQDPYMFFGLLVSQALKRFEFSRGAMKDRELLKELAKLDLQMKTTGVEPWMLVKGFLLRVGKM